MRTLLCAFAFDLVLVCAPVFAQDPLPRAQPESVGIASDRLERIGQVLRADIERDRRPGAVVAIARKGRLAYFEAFGYLDKPAGVPMTADAIFGIGSMTKPMVGVAIMQLVEDTRIQMSDPVSRWFPKLGQLRVAAEKPGVSAADSVPAAREITIHDLLRHTSGLVYGRGSTALYKMFPSTSFGAAQRFTGAELIEHLAKVQLPHQPGSTWEYGLSMDVLGLVIEAETAKTLGTYLSERIFTPLRMIDTGFMVPPAQTKRYARALPNDPATGKPQVAVDRTRPFKFECGGTCAVSTAADYLRFAQMLLNRGTLDDVRILSSRAIDYMTANHLGPDVKNQVGITDPTKAGYGFGLTVAVRTALGGAGMMGSPGMYSWSGATGTDFWVDPKEQLAVVFMAAAPGVTRWHYRRAINALVYQALID